jgi:sugar/nucleoside kinase (ribokinase family)
MSSLDVVCIGAVVLDLPLGPVSIEVFRQESTMLEEIRLTTGGDAMNEAVILSRLGKKTGLIGQIGKDFLGDLIIEACNEEGIDHRGLVQDEEIRTRINVALIKEDGQRTFLKSTDRSPTSAGTLGSLPLGIVDLPLIGEARALSLASIFASKLRDPNLIYQILAYAKKQGLITFADTVPMRPEETLKLIGASLPFIDYFFANLEEAQQLTGEEKPERMATKLLETGIGHVTIKMGKEGCFLANREQTLKVPGWPARVVDTTGAGDNFAAAFISSVLDGKSFEECGRYANLVAALSTEERGATAAVTGIARIKEFALAHPSR